MSIDRWPTVVRYDDEVAVDLIVADEPTIELITRLTICIWCKWCHIQMGWKGWKDNTRKAPIKTNLNYFGASINRQPYPLLLRSAFLIQSTCPFGFIYCVCRDQYWIFADLYFNFNSQFSSIAASVVFALKVWQIPIDQFKSINFIFDFISHNTFTFYTRPFRLFICLFKIWRKKTLHSDPCESIGTCTKYPILFN